MRVVRLCGLAFVFRVLLMERRQAGRRLEKAGRETQWLGRERGRVTWYLRSAGDHDTHHGELRANGRVTASCGAEFVPRPLVFGRGPALPGYPPDPDQVCAVCAARGKAGHSRSGT